MNASRLLLLAMAVSPAILFGQKHDELVSIQRDVAQLEDQMKQLQKSVDEKTAALMALLQQSIDASNKTAAALTAMHQSVDQKLAEQQTKLIAPVATLSTKVDELSGGFSSVRENVAELVRHLNEMDAKVTELNAVMRTLQTPVPPPPGNNPAGAAVQAPDSTPPAGMSVELSYNTALGDYNAKRDDHAIDEFAKYVQYFPNSANAPSAQYYIGQIYYRAQDWENAAKAFDAVLEKYPKNPKTSEAQYFKACALLNGHHKTAAGDEFKSFIKSYPESTHVPEAHKHLRELGMEGPQRRKE